ncbi:extracellular solute-binding protein [Jannaschia pohangensis]|uniref:Microcin C transport system substrate-binding protein n=1 Tax=Jannaschia pohangensis TaxID=390807 RepID=A0A1I3MC86_9RHOB|nr:extracellular solute-binding protein [Jannaschia pohangensis]SFI94306.1 microcin C transport system substrate-binding protein [Jannaschia pohangensis]
MFRRIALISALAAASTAAVAQDGGGTVSHGYSNFGELKYGPGEPFSYVNLDAPKGGEISFSAIGTFDSFNAYTRKGNPDRSGDDILYENLMIAALDDPYGLYCNLCTTIEYGEGLDWVIVNLREDVTFSDGTPMTAEDVKFTIDLFLEQGIAEFRTIIDGFFTSIEVTGPHQIRFEFEESAPVRDRMGLVGLWNPFSKAWFEETGARLDESTDTPFMGTGPYVLGSVDIGRSVVYEKNPDWWGADLPINQGRFNFDRVRVEYFSDSAAAMEGFKAGEYTFRQESSSKEWATSYDFPAVAQGYVVRETPPDGNITTAQGFVFNLREEKWQDPRVRDAVRMMFNFEWSNETLFYGLYERPVSFWGGSDLAAEGVPGPEELAVLQPLVDEGLLDASILTDEAVLPPVNDASGNTPDRRTRRTALGLLEEAGWTPGTDGMLRNAAGETMELVIIQFNPTLDRIINPYIENLRSLGIDARLERNDRAQYIERRRNGDWDLTNHAPGQDFEPGLGLRQWFDSSTAVDSSRNLMALADPAIDRIITEVIAADNLDDLRFRTRALDRVLRAYGFWIPQWGNKEHWVAYWDEYGHPEELPALGLGVLDFWWHNAEGAARLRAAGVL